MHLFHKHSFRFMGLSDVVSKRSRHKFTLKCFDILKLKSRYTIHSEEFNINSHIAET